MQLGRRAVRLPPLRTDPISIPLSSSREFIACKSICPDCVAGHGFDKRYRLGNGAETRGERWPSSTRLAITPSAWAASRRRGNGSIDSPENAVHPRLAILDGRLNFFDPNNFGADVRALITRPHGERIFPWGLLYSRILGWQRRARSRLTRMARADSRKAAGER